MMKKLTLRFIALALTLTLLFLSISACATKPADQTQNTAQTSGDGTVSAQAQTSGAGAGQANSPQTGSPVADYVNPAIAVAQNEGSKILKLAISSDPKSINPLAPMGGGIGSQVIYLPLTTLSSGSGGLEFVNRIATSITSADDLLYTIKIRNDVTWTDGTKVTADDLIFTVNAYTSPDVGGATASSAKFNRLVGTNGAGQRADGSKPLDAVKKVDDYTFTIQLKDPTTLELFNLNIGQTLITLPYHLLKDVKAEDLGVTPILTDPKISCGQFLFEEYAPGEYWYFTRNDSYFGGAPLLDGLQIKVLSMANIAAQIESGELDGNYPPQGYLPAEDYDRIKALPFLKTGYVDPTNHGVIYINNKVVDNVKVRQAISLAIDRQKIVDQVFSGDGYPINAPASKQIKYWDESYATAEYNPEKAKQLLQESGWDISRPLKFELQTGNAARLRAVELMKEQLDAVGFNIEISTADWAELNGRLLKLDYDLAIFNAPDNPLDWVTPVQAYAGTEGSSTGYSNPEMDAYIAAAKSAVKEEDLRAAYSGIQRLITQDYPVVGLWMDFSLAALNERVTYGEIRQYGTLIDIEKWDVAVN